jgi:two-component system, NtrC family, sensor histidine kinase KinB
MTMTVTAVEDEIARLQRQLERERQARQAAEAIAETNLLALFEEKNRAEALVRTASRLSAQLDLATVLTAICEETAHALNLPIVSISLYDSRLEALIYTYGYGLPADFGSQMRPVPRAVYEQYIEGNLVVTDDVQALTDFPNADLYRNLNIRTTLNVSMIYEGRLAGRLNVATVGHVRHFSADEIALLRGLANQGALALENAQLFQATQRQVEELSLLNAVVVAGADAVREDELLERVTTVMGSFYPDNLGILMLDKESGMLRPHLSSRNRLQALGLPGVPLGQGITGRVALSGQPYLAADVTLDPDYLAGFSETRSELCVPLRVGERIIGVINVESPQVAAYGRQDQQLLVTLAAHLATAIEKVRLRQSERRYLDELRQAKEELEIRVEERTAELTASLADLRTLINASQDGIILVSPLGRVRVVNEAAVHLLGLPGSPADWTNRPMAEALSAVRHHAPAAVETIAAELSRSEQLPAEGESEIPPRFIRWLNLPVVSDQVALGRLFVLRDVTEERLLQRMRDDLTHTMVHDLRNPLTAIMTSLNLLSARYSSTLSAEQERLAGVANRSAKQLLKLVNAILDTTRLESGQMPLKWEPLSITDLVEELLQSQAALAEAKGLRLLKELPAALPFISADHDLLNRVLQNLIGNAIKFTPSGGSIWVGVGQPEPADDRGHLTIFVRDTGPGIPLELQNHLFQKFVTGGQEGHGSGLGLAFCRLAAEAHGGRAWLESEPGHGATFYISLPL